MDFARVSIKRKPSDRSAPAWRRRLDHDLLPYILLAPAVITLLSLTVYPLIFSIYISFFRFRGGRPSAFIGLDNYERLLGDAQYWNSIKVIVLYVVFAVVLELILGTLLALFFTQELRFRRLWRTLVIMPMMLTPVIIGVIWRLMYDPNFGVIGHLMQLVGLPPLEWLAKGDLAFIAVVLVDVWNWTPFVFLIVLAGLESLPVEPFEAARVDGASRWQTFRYLTFPMLYPTLLIALLIRSMDAFRIFDQIFVMTRGGPGASTEVASLYLHKTAFKFQDFGYAAAGLFVLVILITVLSQVYIRVLGGGYER